MPKTKKGTETKPEAGRTEEAPTPTPAASLGGTPVVTMPKYNPYHRPAAMQETDTTPIRQTYEDIQREAEGPGTGEWRAADKARAQLSEFYRNLQEDERYSQEYKSQTAWAKYEETRAKVEQLAPEAREKMLRSAETLERLSIPVPEQQGLLTKDTDRLLLTAHERSRLEGLVNRAEKQGSGPFKVKPVDLLRAEYERGLAEGGPGGGATVRAVVQLARDYGLDINAIVDGRRKPHHRESLADAEQARRHAQMVGRSVPQPPFPHPRHSQSKDVGTYGSRRRAFTGRDTAPTGEAQRKPGASRRRSHWK